jgi:hypothetical protein
MAAYGPANDLHMRHNGYLVARLGQIIADGTADGSFQSVHALFAAELLNVVMTSISDGTLVERTGLSSFEAVSELKQVLFHGLMAEQTPPRTRGRR